MIELYINYGPLVVAAILGAIAWLYFKFLADKIKSARWSQMIVRAGLSLRMIILEGNNTYVNELKDAGQDGEWTDVEKAKAKKMAIDKFKEQWGVTGLKELAKVVGFGDALDSWIGTNLEATISEMKALTPKS